MNCWRGCHTFCGSPLPHPSTSSHPPSLPVFLMTGCNDFAKPLGRGCLDFLKITHLSTPLHTFCGCLLSTPTTSPPPSYPFLEILCTDFSKPQLGVEDALISITNIHISPHPAPLINFVAVSYPPITSSLPPF